MRSNPYQTVLEQKKKPLFIPFVVLGDPNKEQSLEVIKTLVESGADALELGLPFSDPPADGPVIQAADTRALQSGIRIDDCFEMLKELRSFTDIPIGLLVYHNLVLQRGVEKFYADCAEAGVDSVLIADLPLEHARDVVPIAQKNSVASVMLVSELTTDDRMREIAEIADGYLYVVSYVGVTGRKDVACEEGLRKTLKRSWKHSSLPCFVGFGIHTSDDVTAAVHVGANGVIVGSRIVKEIPDMKEISALCAEFLHSLPLDSCV